MKKYISILIIPRLFLATTLTASYFENYVVQAKILAKLSNNKTKKILKKYNTFLTYNRGVQVTVIQAKAINGSHSTNRFAKGQKIEIVTSTDDETLLSLIKKGNKLTLTYTYEDDITDDGLYESSSWVLEK